MSWTTTGRTFCLPPGAPIHCWDVSKATVRDTFYLVRHNGAQIQIGAGGENLRFSREAAHVLDKVVASWRWTE
jgi:hypothetical protein